MKFKITIENQVFHPNMVENDITKEIEKHLPLTTTYYRYTEHEYYTRLPFSTSDKNCKKETMAYKNEIWYFGGWNAFTILFKDCNTSLFEVVNLGKLEEDIIPLLKDNKQELEITVEKG